MNLRFKTIRKVTKGSTDYYMQRAVVTGERSFWSQWRAHKTVSNNPLRKFLTIRREPDENGKSAWFAYRLLPVDSGLPYGTFNRNYTIVNKSGLLPYQIRPVEELSQAILTHGAALDGSDTGTGKTYASLATARELGLRPAVVCKKAGFGAWAKGCRHFGIKPLFILNYEKLKAGNTKFLSRTPTGSTPRFRYTWKLPPRTLLIFDEAHEANNTSTLNCAMLAAATGIPLIAASATFADRPQRMYPFVRITGAMDGAEFNAWLERRGQFTNRYHQNESIAAADDMSELNKLFFPSRGTRVSINDPEVLKNFPNGVYQTKIISLSKKETERQNALYEKMLQKAEEYTAMGKKAEALVANLRYRQSAELLKAPALIEITGDLIKQNRSVVIFVNFRETMSYIARETKTRHLIYGDQKDAERAKILDDFNNDKARFIIAMAAAGGQSLDLHDTNGLFPRVSLICPTYNPIHLKQILGRTRRAGSLTTPVMQLVYTENTIEEQVAESVNAKLDNIAALNDGDLMEPDLFKIGIPSED